MGTHDRTVRGSEERRVCRVCEKPYTVTRTAGWNNKTCSQECGYKIANDGRRLPPRTATCKICGVEFSYKRPGTTPRTICDNDDCRREVSRRAGMRTPSEETRRRISESKRRNRGQGDHDSD